MGTACRRCRLKHIQHRNNRREKRKEKKMFKAKRAESKREICPPFANPTTNKRKKRIPDGIKNKTGECHQRLAVAVITSQDSGNRTPRKKRQPDSGFDANKGYKRQPHERTEKPRGTRIAAPGTNYGREEHRKSCHQEKNK